MTDVYAQDGVNISEGDKFSSFAGGICRNTYESSEFVEIRDFSLGHFRGPRGFRLKNLPDDVYFDLAPDGIGTKVVVIDAAFGHTRAGQDLMAMCNGDITRWGGLPLVFTNVLDVASLGDSTASTSSSEFATNERLRDMIGGLGRIAADQGMVLYKGETAELGHCVGSENLRAVVRFNWAGTSFGVYHDDKMITGDTLAPGQAVIALRELGFRSNGISSVRKALAREFTSEWFRNSKAAPHIAAAAMPSVLYDRFLTHANGWHAGYSRIKMHLIVHVTGGALKSKLGEDILFPRGLSADLPDLWDPPEIMRLCARWRGMTDEQCYETWNGGQGALVVVDSNSAEKFVAMAKRFGIDAEACGQIVESKKPFVRIRSKFNGGKDITFYAR